MIKNILLGGTMRSGTTLMSSILDSHPDITLISDIIKWYWSKVYLEYNTISTPYELDMIFYEMAPHIYHGLHDDQIEKFANGEIRKKIIDKGISYYSIYETLVEFYNTESKIERIVGSKATHVGKIYSKFIEQFEKPLIIHMMRDCRDVYFSHNARVLKLRQKPINRIKVMAERSKNIFVNKVMNKRSSELFNRKSYLFKYPIKIMDDWVFTNSLAFDIKKQHPENIIILKYEDFVSEPEKHIQEVYNKIGITSFDGSINYNNLKDRDGNKFQANTSHNLDIKKISNKNIYHSHKKLSKFETQYYFDNITEAAKSFGY